MGERGWCEGPIVGFDLETTGTDPLTAQVVTAAVVYHYPDDSVGPDSHTWLVDPGVPIPDAATAVHGITTDHAKRHGIPLTRAIPAIAAALEEAWQRGFPLVVFNAAYDLTLLHAALARLGEPSLLDRRGWPDAVILDPLVLDRALDRFRRGKRTLGDMTAHYGVRATDAHSADGDAVATCRLMRAIARKYPDIAAAEAGPLRSQQQVWAAEWATRFQAFLRSRGETGAVIDGSWPLRLG